MIHGRPSSSFSGSIVFVGGGFVMVHAGPSSFFGAVFVHIDNVARHARPAAGGASIFAPGSVFAVLIGRSAGVASRAAVLPGGLCVAAPAREVSSAVGTANASFFGKPSRAPLAPNVGQESISIDGCWTVWILVVVIDGCHLLFGSGLSFGASVAVAQAGFPPGTGAAGGGSAASTRFPCW